MPNPIFAAQTKTPPKHVVFVLYDDVTLTDFVGATEVFNVAPDFEIHWLAPTMDPVTTSEKMRVLPTGTFEDCPETGVEILFVPGGDYRGVVATMFDKRYMDFIGQTAKIAHWTGSVCTGAFILAAAGGFHHCPVTTYWSQLENLALLSDKYRITVDTEHYPRYVVDAQNRRFSGGGISSSLDLALELVKHISGNKASQMAQLFIQYAPHPPNRSGDPSQAPPSVVQAAKAAEHDYTEEIRKAVVKLKIEN